MYEKLLMLQPVAEQIGAIKTVAMHQGDSIWDDGIKLVGETADGKRFELELTIKDGDGDA